MNSYDLIMLSIDKAENDADFQAAINFDIECLDYKKLIEPMRQILIKHVGVKVASHTVKNAIDRNDMETLLDDTAYEMIRIIAIHARINLIDEAK